MYHVSAQGVDERMINVHYYYYCRQFDSLSVSLCLSVCGFCGRKATLKRMKRVSRTQLKNYVNREVGLGSHTLSHSAPVPDKPYGLCGRKTP